MSRIKERIQVVINSRNRLNPDTDSSSNFTWSYNEIINRITEIRLDSIQIPFMWYIINNTNNTLVVNGNDIVVSEGNYTATTIIPELINKIDAVIGNNTTITFSSITGKLTISGDNPIQIFADNPPTTNSPLASLLGFLENSSSALSITGDSTINISGPNYIRIVSDFLTKPINNKTIFSDDSLQNSLLVIPVHSSFGDIITHESDLPLRLSYKFTIRPSDIIDIKLIDEFNNIIDLNGQEWAAQMTFITE